MIAAHIAARGHEPVVPTMRMLRYWFPRLNKALFGGSLHPCQLVLAPLTGNWGTCDTLSDGRVRITLSTTQEWTRSALIGTLAHEMVHQYQHQHGLPLTHGDAFKSWADDIKAAIGLEI